NSSLTEFADLTGVRISGSLLFDLGAAPAPAVSVDGTGALTTQIFTTALPVFVSQTFTIDGFTVPSGFFAIPTVFDQPAIPSIPVSTVTTTVSTQSLNTNVIPGGAQAIVGSTNFINGWTGPRFGGGNLLFLAVLISDLQPFFTIPPSGSFPENWGPVNLGG